MHQPCWVRGQFCFVPLYDIIPGSHFYKWWNGWVILIDQKSWRHNPSPEWLSRGVFLSSSWWIHILLPDICLFLGVTDVDRWCLHSRCSESWGAQLYIDQALDGRGVWHHFQDDLVHELLDDLVLNLVEVYRWQDSNDSPGPVLWW